MYVYIHTYVRTYIHTHVHTYSVLKVGKRPVCKSELTNRYLKQFIRYINSVDLEEINHSNKQI
jgi:hypothetical protein